MKETNREVMTNWRDLLAHVKSEGMREAQVQRYKGLGEMNAEQLVGNHDERRDAHAAAGPAGRHGASAIRSSPR